MLTVVEDINNGTQMYLTRIFVDMVLLLLYSSHNVHVARTVQAPDDLFETISQALLNAVDRDALSGWGAVVHIM